MSKKFIQAKLERNEKGQIQFVASDETLDRQGEVIPIDSWDLTNYKKNPVLLVNHDYKVQNIVGRAESIGFIDRNGKTVMVFDPVFHGITQLAQEVEAMVKEGILNTVSVGFLRKAPSEDGDTQINELMEISFVPVPANPSAERIKSLIDPQISEEEKSKIKSFAGAKEGRVLSSRNRKLIGQAVQTLKDSVSALEDLLAASEPEKGLKATDIQTLLLSKKRFEKLEDAKKWVTDNEYSVKNLEDTSDAWHFIQLDPKACKGDSFKTIDITDGVKAVVCNTKGVCYDDDQDDASGRGANKETPELGKGKGGKGRAGQKNSKELRVLQRVAKEINLAIYQAKRK